MQIFKGGLQFTSKRSPNDHHFIKKVVSNEDFVVPKLVNISAYPSP